MEYTSDARNQTPQQEGPDDRKKCSQTSSSRLISMWNAFIWKWFKEPFLKGLLCLATTSATYPIATIVGFTILSLGLAGVGFLTNFRVEITPSVLWTPIGSITDTHGNLVDSNAVGFPAATRDLFLAIHGGSGEGATANILDMDAMHKVFQALDIVRSTSGYGDLCSSAAFNADIQEENDCPITSPTGYWKDHNYTLFNETVQSQDDIIQALSSLWFHDFTPVDRAFLYGHPTPVIPEPAVLLEDIDFDTFDLSQLEASYNLTLESVSAFLVTIRLPSSDEKEDNYLSFEDEVASRLLQLAKEWREDDDNRFVLDFYSASSYDTESFEEFSNDTFLIYPVFVSMVVVCCSFLYRKDPVKSQTLLGLGGLWTVVLSMLASAGLTSCFNVPLTAISQFFLFAMLGIGLDDTFLILGAMDRAGTASTLSRIEAAIKDVGLSITVSTLTTTVAILLAGLSDLPAVRWFAWFAAPMVAIDFLYQVTFFIALVALDEQRQTNQRRDLCPCCQVRGSTNEEDEESRSNKVASETDSNATSENLNEPNDQSRPQRKRITGRAANAYVDFVLSRMGKVIVITVFTALAVTGSLNARHVTLGFDWRVLLSSDSYVISFFDVLNANFERRVNGDFDATFYFQNFDFSLEENQDAMIDFVDDIVDMPYIESAPSFFWLTDFQSFVNQTEDIQDLTFEDQIDKFLSTLPYSLLYQSDIARNEDNQVVATRTHFAYDNVDQYNSAEQVDALKLQQSIAKKQPLNDGLEPRDWKAFTFGYYYNGWSNYARILPETTAMIAFGLSAMFVISLIFVPNPIGALLITPTVAFIFVEVVGVLSLADIPLNTVSAPVLTVGLGLAVDFNLHVVMAYFECSRTGRTRKERVKDSLLTVGKGVFLGGLTTLAGVVPTAFGSTHVFYVGFVVYFTMVVLGLAHGLILMPVLLSMFGSIPNKDGGSDATHSRETSSGSSKISAKERIDDF